MSKYCMSCGAANSNAANVCTRCGETLGGMSTEEIPAGGGGMSWQQIKPESGTLPLKYRIGGIAMFVCAGITVLMMIISLANSEEYMSKLLMQSRDIPDFTSLDQMRAIYMGSVIGTGLIGAGIYLHCGFLLRKTQIQKRRVLISYSILFGLSALTTLVGFTNANSITITNILSLGIAVGSCVLLIMKYYDCKLERRYTCN